MRGIQLVKFIKSTALPDLFLGGVAYARGISYPDRLIGRRNFPHSRPQHGQVLVIAAHPDDEVLGLGFTLIRHRADGADVTVVFATNGAGDWKRASSIQEALSARRFLEACDALGTIGIPSQNVISLGFPDSGLRRYIPELATDIALLIRTHQPKAVYVHALEGGHRDHDVTSFVVQHVGARLGVENLYEWAEYNADCPLWSSPMEIRFPADPYVVDQPFWRTSSTETERSIKAQMLAKYSSQASMVNFYPLDQEVLRRANPVQLVSRLKYFGNLSDAALRHLRVPQFCDTLQSL